MGRVYFPTTSLNRFGVRDTDEVATLRGLSGERFPADPTPRSAANPTGPLLGGLGLTALQIRSDISDYPASRAVLLNRTPVIAAPRPAPVAPIRVVTETPRPAPVAVSPAAPAPTQNWVPLYQPPAGPAPYVAPPTPTPAPISASGGGGAVSNAATAGTPVPAGQSPNSLFIDSSGGYWEYSSSSGRWVNTGTPYNTGGPAPVSAQTTPTPTVTIPVSTATTPTPVLVSSGGGTQTPALAVYTTDAYGNIVNSQTGALVMSAAQASSMGTSAASLNAGATGSAGGTGLVDQFTAWLGSSTSLLGYNVPNALLAGAVVLGFAALESGGGRRR